MAYSICSSSVIAAKFGSEDPPVVLLDLESAGSIDISRARASIASSSGAGAEILFRSLYLI